MLHFFAECCPQVAAIHNGHKLTTLPRKQPDQRWEDRLVIACKNWDTRDNQTQVKIRGERTCSAHWHQGLQIACNLKARTHTLLSTANLQLKAGPSAYCLVGDVVQRGGGDVRLCPCGSFSLFPGRCLLSIPGSEASTSSAPDSLAQLVRSSLTR